MSYYVGELFRVGVFVGLYPKVLVLSVELILAEDIGVSPSLQTQYRVLLSFIVFNLVHILVLNLVELHFVVKFVHSGRTF